ncbi:AAA family ATPase [Candidatus Parcubacteria bacterium]|nr:AAA family ATPase [Candidatus Parcubacteria bacterium]
MYLEKLQIQGFKSFANKNTLVFPGMLSKSKRGVTAIVGPNGSGKSNVADAVRWALGEQSMKTLRGKKSEDVIFSGSDKKGRLGMAEVSLYLNNENGLIDLCMEDRGGMANYSQIVLTRRLYRDGNSEYMINNSRTRLSDIQIMLAKAKFGQKTYSVIGQGMVEGFLNTSLSERKEFFDEATGVKQFQIKRDESLNKLRSSYENLNQAQMLLSEIEPRLKSLARQVNKLQKRGEIEIELKGLQQGFYGKIWHEINNKFSEYNKQFLDIERVKRDKEKKLDGFSHDLSEMEKDHKDLTKLMDWQQELTEAQNQKDLLIKQLAKIEARIEVKFESSGQFDLSWLANKKEELGKETATIEEEINMLTKNIELEKEKLPELEKGKKAVDSKIQEFNRKLVALSSASNNETVQNINNQLNKSLNKLRQAEAESSIDKIKTILQQIKQELKQTIKISSLAGEKNNLEQTQQNLSKTIEKKEKLITAINETSLRISARSERVKLLTEKKLDLQNELTTIKSKLGQQGVKISSKEQQEVKQKINEMNKKIADIKEKINKVSSQEENKRNQLFDLQKKLQNLQNEINNINNRLSEIKINSTRFETRLEDLEIEIRQNYGSLKEIKEYKFKEGRGTNQEAALEKINQLKHQLDLIGGIDPEIAKEYQETKERYDFLSNQVNDLTKAIGSLEQIIKKLDLIIKEKFDKEFKIILTKFEEYFKILFNGGRAKIIKVMENTEDTENTEITEKNKEINKKEIDQNINVKKIKFLQKHNATGLAGIEIQATPPGKKIKSINMLSGGERALTAIALICAIISANPSPFVVLDEVDAALDEANSERFAKILDDLAHKTQFIVITHNRASMRKANILYGITMGNDGVSKLLSIKLEEVKS